ncbi:MAG: glycosyltransferase family A protein [Tenuifilaceae bacterium]|jgi:glycosyltransferase involved in cell wall biosynthesis|nr:glycosyltransferase family A protein [Bacteroidales bacterium]MDI9515426.1 glycosyltransferase family A protein [Bacteroidota bacterium]NLH57627.1 glycosyltransferase family 2 protein [Rikenellaceae bacterium]OQC63085.1 MAG: Glycosyl transferase family 2 [Bacteroidetes bacterium ADurb.Bin008]HNV82358.1 glycosyltransferase family A protein [Tenuifilaceae bacterium]
MAQSYYFGRQHYVPRLLAKVNDALGIVVVIPAYNEPDLWQSLQSLMDCQTTDCAVEVIVVVNYPEGSTDEVVANAEANIQLVQRANDIKNSEYFRLYAIDASNLTKKHAGVGLARKIGMDEAAWRLFQSKSHLKVVACFDADATCSDNYLAELEKLWSTSPETEACSIRYEHPMEGDEFDGKVYQGITQYELHLRYYVQACRYVGHPFSYHTVGSSMACSATAYTRYGGMNRNKAGEDFYFLQKIIPHGRFKELNACCIFPSPRPSYRVPFGTGRAITSYISNREDMYHTYSLDSWMPLKPFFENIHELHQADATKCQKILSMQVPCLREFLKSNRFEENIAEINANTSTPESFQKRFFLWFDAFLLLKYLNIAAEKCFPKVPVTAEAHRLANLLKISFQPNPLSDKCLLQAYRRWEYCL